MLSILIPTYNREAALRRCLESVLSQTNQDIEILVSDNHSDDHTADFLRGIADPRLRWWSHSQNLGMAKNLLSLVKAARGEYVFILTDDSYLPDGALARLFSILAQYSGVGVVVSKLQYCNLKSGDISYLPGPTHTEKFAPGNEGLPAIWIGIHIWPRLVVRRDLIDCEIFERQLSDLYPTLGWVSGAILKGGLLCLNEVLVVNIAGNKNFWNYPGDFDIYTRFVRLEELFPGSDSKALRIKLRRIMVLDVLPNFVTWKRIGGLVKLLQEPDVSFYMPVWMVVGRTLLMRIRSRLKYK